MRRSIADHIVMYNLHIGNIKPDEMFCSALFLLVFCLCLLFQSEIIKKQIKNFKNTVKEKKNSFQTLFIKLLTTNFKQRCFLSLRVNLEKENCFVVFYIML